jgi:hypothetical protein
VGSLPVRRLGDRALVDAGSAWATRPAGKVDINRRIHIYASVSARRRVQRRSRGWEVPDAYFQQVRAAMLSHGWNDGAHQDGSCTAQP